MNKLTDLLRIVQFKNFEKTILKQSRLLKTAEIEREESFHRKWRRLDMQATTNDLEKFVI